MNDGGGGGKFTGFEHVGKVFGFRDVEVAGNLRAAARDGGVDDRIGIDHTVEHDGNLAADVVLGHLGPGVGAFRVHRHRNIGVAASAIAKVDTGIGDRLAVEGSLAVHGGGLDGYEFVGVAAGDILGGLDAPHRFEFSGEEGLNLRHRQVTVDLGGVGIVGITDAGTLAEAALIRVGAQNGEEGILLLEVGERSGVFAFQLGSEGVGRGNGSGFHFTGTFHIGQQFVGFREERIDFGILVGGPELEGGGTLEEFTHTLGLFDAREFHEDTAGVANLLDAGLGHAETVDTVAQHVEGVADGALRFLADDGDNLLVGGFGMNLLVHLIGAENLAQATAVCVLLPGFPEEGDEVLGGVDAVFLRGLDGSEKFRTAVVVGEGFYQVFQLHLQHHVHTALQVQTEVDFFFLDGLVSIGEIYFLRGN